MASTPADQIRLARATSAHEFFRCFFIKDELSLKPLTYSEFCRRAGFSSMAFPREVFLGRRNITLKSLPKFIKGLRLSGLLEVYFSHLVELEQSNTDDLSRTLLEQEIERIRERLVNGRTRQESRGDFAYAEKIFAIENLPIIYACLGVDGNPTSFHDLEDRSSLPRKDLETALERMQEVDLIEGYDGFDSTAIRVKSLHLALSETGQSDLFRRFFLKACESMRSAGKDRIQSKEELFFSSCFLVDRKRLPELKKNLRDLLYQFSEDSEDSRGSQIVSLTVGFHMPTGRSS